jgi:hypothetical protein
VITVTDANPAAMRKSAPESGQFVEQRSQSSALSKRYKKIVILSGAETSRSEVSAESKDPCVLADRELVESPVINS